LIVRPRTLALAVLLACSPLAGAPYRYSFEHDTVETVCPWPDAGWLLVGTDQRVLAWDGGSPAADPGIGLLTHINDCIVDERALVIADAAGLFIWKHGEPVPTKTHLQGEVHTVRAWQHGLVALATVNGVGDVLEWFGPDGTETTLAHDVTSVAVWGDELVFTSPQGAFALSGPTPAPRALTDLDAPSWVVTAGDVLWAATNDHITAVRRSTVPSSVASAVPLMVRDDRAIAWNGRAFLATTDGHVLEAPPNGSAIVDHDVGAPLQTGFVPFAEHLYVGTTSGLVQVDALPASEAARSPVLQIGRVTALATVADTLAIASYDDDTARSTLSLWQRGAPRPTRLDLHFATGAAITILQAWNGGFVVASRAEYGLVSRSLFESLGIELEPLAGYEPGQPVTIRWRLRGDSEDLGMNAKFSVVVSRGTQAIASPLVTRSSDGTWSARVPTIESSGNYSVLVRASFPMHAEKTASATFDVHERGVSLMLVLPLLAILTVGAGVIVSVGLRRALYVLLGRRWMLVTGTCDRHVEVAAAGEAARVTFWRPAAPDPARPSLLLKIPPVALSDDAQACVRASIPPGSTVLVSIVDTLIACNWPKVFGASWSRGSEAIVCGQVILTEQTASPEPSPTKRLRFSVLACPKPRDDRVPLLNVMQEAGAVVRTLQRWAHPGNGWVSVEVA
jgi:hypothetical protein